MAQSKKQMKGDLNKEAMYRKIMPSIPVNDNEDDESLVELAHEEAITYPGRDPFNVMEMIVRSKVPNIMDKLGSCGCPQCKSDIIALALNKLPAIYSGAGKDSIRERIQLIRKDYEIKIISAIIQAVQTVSESPRHYSNRNY